MGIQSEMMLEAETQAETADMLLRMRLLLEEHPGASISDLQMLASEQIEEERRDADLDYLSKDD